ncbi:MAG: hypothetical protein PHQ88_05865 [Bacteroides sp.]|nr:hypothetical protein [Bacteroides sp.]MDD2646298.1 hypothetical protein [Bacteroides sp.]MDD4720368.1 hypothetical protein [Bacteroides sp.]
MEIQLDKLPEARLYENHNQTTLKKWCQGLRYFHYMRARRGHNCEGDSFAAHFNYQGRADLLEKLGQLKITLQEVGEDDLVFDPLKSYSIDDLDRIKYTIPGLPDLIQPNKESLFGYEVHLCIQQHTFELIVAGTQSQSAYEVSDSDYEVCLSIEKELDKLGWSSFLDQEIKKQPHCISATLYPELYR